MSNSDASQTTPPLLDALVVGAGPAGLQAALTLSRVHRTVLLVDDGRPRNAAASHMHNVVSHDGTPPAEFRATALGQLTAYDTCRVLEDRVQQVRPLESGFEATMRGGETVMARTVVLATGVRDRLPDLPGLTQLWGRLVHHCPFCHGHELAGQRVGILASERAAHLQMLLAPIAGEVVVVQDADSVSETEAGRVQVRDIRGGTQELDGLFVPTDLELSAPHAVDLGLDLLPSGAVQVDPFGRTSLPGVFAAGDMAHLPELPMAFASVIAAAAAGAAAASGAVAHLLAP